MILQSKSSVDDRGTTFSERPNPYRSPRKVYARPTAGFASSSVLTRLWLLRNLFVGFFCIAALDTIRAQQRHDFGLGAALRHFSTILLGPMTVEQWDFRIIGLMTIIGFLFHPVFPRRWSASITIFAFLWWVILGFSVAYIGV